MDEMRIPKRSEVPLEYTWDLTHIFPSDEAWMAAYEAASQYVEKAASYRGKLSTSSKDLLAFLRMEDQLSLDLGDLAEYAMRKADEDTSNAFYLDMRGKFMKVYMEIMAASAYATPEILSIPDDVMESFYRETPDLELYRRALDKDRARRNHVLSDAEERIMAAVGEVCDAPDNIGSTLRDADLRFPSVTDADGVEYPLTQGSFVSILQSSDRDLRAKTFKTFYGVFDGFKNTIAAILDGQVKQLIFRSRMRKYPDTLTAALDHTEVPASVYHNLIDTVHAHMDTMYKYMRLRKKLLGVDELHMYDIYPPIVPDGESKISFEEAKENVLRGLAPLGEDYLAIVKEGFDNRWIDVYENEGKRGGAYSAGARPHPYVLLNHKDNLDHQFTLAHEMGHALHSYLSKNAQPVVYSDYVIFVAEVASTCNEVLLMRHLLANTTDKKERAALINYFLEQFRGTVYRQTMFAEFELMMNRRAEAGETLTADLLCSMYYDLNKLYYGPDMVVDPEIALEWERIPHFFYNFYVFQYATGFSAAVAIANRILEEGESAVRDYKKFLSSGSITDPISLLKIAGVDMTTPKPIEDALQLFDSLIDEMDELMK